MHPKRKKTLKKNKMTHDIIFSGKKPYFKIDTPSDFSHLGKYYHTNNTYESYCQYLEKASLHELRINLYDANK